MAPFHNHAVRVAAAASIDLNRGGQLQGWPFLQKNPVCLPADPWVMLTFLMTLGALVFTWTVPVLQFVLVLVFLNRRIFITKFPAFFGYTCFAVAANVLQIAFFHDDSVFYWVYWSTEVIYGVVALLVMQEVFGMVWDLKQGNRRFSVWALILLIAGASLLWGFHRPDGIGTLPAINAAFRTFMAGVYVVEVLLLALALRFIRKLTRYHLGIMLGFGTSASVQVVAYIAYFFHRGPLLREVVAYAPLSAYLASAGIWLSTFLSKPRVTMRLDPDAILDWISEQERIAKEMSSGSGLKWPGKKKSRDNGSKQVLSFIPERKQRSALLTHTDRSASYIKISEPRNW
jgi:hypothetical protein